MTLRTNAFDEGPIFVRNPSPLTDGPARQPYEMHPARVVHLPAPLAAGDLGEQVRQRDVWPMDEYQLTLGILPAPAALLAREAHRVAGVVAEFEGAGQALPSRANSRSKSFAIRSGDYRPIAWSCFHTMF